MYRSPTILVFPALLLFVAGCQPGQEVPTSPPEVASSGNPTPEPPFARSDIVPGKTTSDEVRALLGEPASIFGPSPVRYEGTEVLEATWTYEEPLVGYIIFKDDVVSYVLTRIADYTLGDLIAELGRPEAVEMIRPWDLEPPALPAKEFHYPSLGMSYRSVCLVDGEHSLEGCSQHHSDEVIVEVQQYVPKSLEEVQQDWLSIGTFVKWQGFSDD